MRSAKGRSVVVGASHAGAQVATRLRRIGWQGEIVLIGEEPNLPYHKPPLSKSYIKSNKTPSDVLINSEAAYTKAGVDVLLGERVTNIDRAASCVETSSGRTLAYDKLVLAIGSRPRPLPLPGAQLPGVHYLRNAADADRIRLSAHKARNALIIGGGYIGLEVAASLRSLGLQVTVIEALERILQRVTSEPVSDFFSRLHRSEGVTIQTEVQVESILGPDKVTGAQLQGGEVINAELVVVGIGVLPNTELAAQAGLDVADGILVNEQTQTSDPKIFAIGDCASFVHSRYGRRLRLESVQNANDQALVAAQSICGVSASYDALPWFWSDQYDVKLQIAGLVDDADEVIVRRDEAGDRRLTVLYMQNKKLIAVDAMNNPRDFVFGKRLIAADVELDSRHLGDPRTELREFVV